MAFHNKLRPLAAGVLAIAVLIGLNSNAFSSSVARAAETQVCTPATLTFVSNGTTMADGSAAVATYKSPVWVKLPGATWVWKSQFTQDPNGTETVTFTKNITIDADDINSAQLQFAADAKYRVSVNGIVIDENNSAVESNYRALKTFDVASNLHVGENTIEAQVTNVVIPEFPINSSMSNPAGLIYKLTANVENCETVTIPDALANLNVSVVVINDDGGTKAAGDVNVSVTGNNPTPASFTGSTSTNVTLGAGDYATNGSDLEGYTKTSSENCVGVMAAGDTKSCVLTYNDTQAPQSGGNNGVPPATLKVITHVINDDGGTAVASDFMMTVTAPSLNASFQGTEEGNTLTINPGNYETHGDLKFDYGYSETETCDGVSAAGQSIVCTITYNDPIRSSGGVTPTPTPTPTPTTDNPGQVLGEQTNDLGVIIVIKHVINDNNGTQTAGDFTMTATGNNVSASTFAGSESGTAITVAPGMFSIDEQAAAGYLKTRAFDCEGTIAAGETKLCIITNNDVAGSVLGENTGLPGMPVTGSEENGRNTLIAILGLTVVASFLFFRRTKVIA